MINRIFNDYYACKHAYPLVLILDGEVQHSFSAALLAVLTCT